MKFKFACICLCAFQFSLSQKVVFTTRDNLENDTYWKMNVIANASPQNITEELNKRALFAGKHRGAITTSHNGNFYVFQSERFDNKIDGYAAITLCNADFGEIEVPKNAAGEAFHAEGLVQITNDGKTIYFVQSSSKHSRDVFKITKSNTTWSDPINLTETSPYPTNTSPYLSYDEKKLLFEGAEQDLESSAILEVNATGTSLTTKTSVSAIAGSKQIKSPCYDPNGNIFFEAETDAERIWKISVSGGAPSILHGEFTNDNSPITLPDGKIASLYLPASTHQIKIMDGTGLNMFMLTQKSAAFEEVFDIGISAGSTSGSNRIEGNDPRLRNSNHPSIQQSRNGAFSISHSSTVKQVRIFEVSGFEIKLLTISQGQYQPTRVMNGIYIFKIQDGNGNLFTQKKEIVSK